MADFYCDWTNGNDTTGNGTSGNPYKTIEKIASLTSGVGTSGNRLFVANTAAQIASATGAAWGTGWTVSDAISNPLLILPWDTGGNITLTTPNGLVIDPAFEWDGNDACASLATDLIGITIFGGYLHSTTNFVWNPNTAGASHLVCCKIEDSGGTSLVDGGLVHCIGCHFVGDASSSQDGLAGIVGGALYNYFDDLTGKGLIMGSAGAVAIGNVFRNCDEGGISITTSANAVAFNTIVGNSSTNNYGVLLGSAADAILMLENIIQGHSGTGGTGIKNTAGAVPVLLMGTSFYNNTTNHDISPQLEHAADTEADDPLVDAAGGDFSVEVASDAYHASHLGPDVANRGASQLENASGGSTGIAALVGGALVRP